MNGRSSSDPSPIVQLVGGKYRIVRLLARGGMGVVYEAQHVVVRRRFAIKFLRPDLAERREILTRFQREAEAAGALENENVAAAVDFGIAEDGAPYIVMEYLVGESLADLLARERRLPIARAADLVAQACHGVASAHAAGIVHRDLKPQNLFVCRRQDGTDLIKVLDFGIAKLQAADDASAATRTGMVLGTAAYMSPEQARGDRVIDNRADVYALGAILYELLSLKRPHPGGSQNAILHHIATQPALPLASIEPDLPGELVDVIDRALDSNPGARPASVESLAEAIATFGRREVWPPREDPAPRPGQVGSTMLLGADVSDASSGAGASGGAASTADDRAIPPVSVPVASSRRPRMTLGVGAALVVVVAVAAVVSRRRAHSPAQPEQTAFPVALPAVDLATRSAAPATPALAPPPAPAPRPQADATLAESTGRPRGRHDSSGRPAPQGARRRADTRNSRVEPPALPQPEEHRPQTPIFDTENPYR
jgi:serine/threonine protein kinase